ncbi:TonB-dependent siderophore receptor [Herbaspirillum sp. WKF16]|uniref:TonB-dependent siderophore receptor n=1 Tax=Herbaspirillum sp. WKF16 TaxID=3028312 RepID=UPI0023A9AFD4|nr:TonB-dependent siderophore receptor [Herbaspirillum sp. WKF16]WDZ95477.1 TonB-dependent siderophore receptor [Herbaspirillum sp. WKF16]
MKQTRIDPRAAIPAPRQMARALRCACAAMALSTLGAGSAWAQQAQSGQDGAAEALPEVKVVSDRIGASEGTGSYIVNSVNTGTRLNLTPRETPQSISVVTRQQMDDRNIQSIEDLVNVVPGLSLSRGATERGSIYSRGFAINMYTMDGLPFSADGDTLGFNTLAMYDRVEVLRGSAGMMIGAGNPSGVINLVRKRPTRETQVSITGSAGRWNNFRGEIDASGALNEAKTVRGRAVVASSDADTFITNYRQKRNLVYATVDADLTRDSTLSVGFSYNKEENLGSSWYGLPTARNGSFLNMDRSVNNAPDWAYWNKTNTRVFTELETRFDNSWKVKLAAQAMKDELDSLLTGIARGAGDTNFALTPANIFKYDRSQLGLDAQATGPFGLFGQKHELVVGASYRSRITQDAGYNDPTYNYAFNLPTWNTASAPYPNVNNYYYASVTRVKQSSLYGTSRLKLADPLALLLGARADWYDTESVNPRAVTNAVTNKYKINSEITPYAALVVDLNKTYSVYGSWTSVFTPQTSVDATGKVLPAVTGSNTEVGIKGELLDGALNVSAAVFQMKQTNLAQSLPVGSCSPGLTSCSVAAGEVQNRGYELQAVGALTSSWQVSGGYTYNAARYTAQSGANLPGARFATDRPARTLRLSTMYRLPGELNRWRIGGAARSQSEMYRTANAIRQGGYTLFDLLGGFQVNKNLDLRFSVTNLFDKVYYQTIGSTADSASAFGEPRNFNVTAKYTF